MKTIKNAENTRGKADFGWLQANFSFSFGNYFNPDKVQFGALRVLNDDTIAAGMGFGMHPHANMEIITIPLIGGLQHKDSMGNQATVSFGEVQVMSAGSGIEHSEMNSSKTDATKTLQLWIFSEKQNIEPRYDQKSFDIENQMNTFVEIVSPFDKNNENSLWVYQQTYLNLGIFEDLKTVSYPVNIAGNGVYLFLIDGEIEVNQTFLSKRDALEITDFDLFEIKIIKKATILLIEVPML